MNLNPREKMIALAVVALIALWVLGSYVIAPFFSARQDVLAKIAKAQLQQKHDEELMANQPKVAAEWKSLTASTLKTQAAQASGEINDALFDFARSSRFTLASLKPDRTLQVKDFQQIRFQLTGTGSSEVVAAFLYHIETTNLPLQIDDFGITTRKEGVDDLNIKITLTTIVFAPGSATKPAKAQAPSGDQL